jgi:hypothetical protein
MNSSRKLTAPPQNADHAIVPLAQRPEYQKALAPLQELEKAYAEREKQRQRLLARARGQSSKRSVAARASDLVAGGKIDPVAINDQLEALDAELGILRVAISEKAEIVDQVAANLSRPENLSLRPQYDAAMRDGLHHMEQMISAFRRAAALPAALVRAGYKPSSMIMPNIVPPAVATLGDTSDGWSQAWAFKRELQDMEII